MCEPWWLGRGCRVTRVLWLRVERAFGDQILESLERDRRRAGLGLAAGVVEPRFIFQKVNETHFVSEIARHADSQLSVGMESYI